MVTLDRTRPASTRVAIAHLADRVIARTDGVVATPGRGRWLTADGGRAIDGVVVGQGTDGVTDVELHLIVEWPPRPLEPLADQLRRELVAEAAAAGLGERLGAIDVSFQDFDLPDAAGEGGR